MATEFQIWNCKILNENLETLDEFNYPADPICNRYGVMRNCLRIFYNHQHPMNSLLNVYVAVKKASDTGVYWDFELFKAGLDG